MTRKGRFLLLLLALLPSEPLRAESPKPEKVIAVTVDDLPINGPDQGIASLKSINERLTAALRKEQIPAVGFVNEAKLYHEGEVDGRIALLKLWLEAGLELGNHTFTHPDFNQVGLLAYEEEVVRGETVTRRLLDQQGRGEKLRWFRHTFLRTGKTLADKAAFERFLEGRGYRVAPVTIENDDWHFNSLYVKAKAKGDQGLMDRVVTGYLDHYDEILDFYEGMSQQLFGRPIKHVLLCHDNELNADHFSAVAARFRSRGYRFISLDEALQDPVYTHEDSYVGGWGKSWLQRWWVTEGRPKRFQDEPDTPDWLDTLK